MLNKIVLIGRLTADPELKYTPSGVAVCTLTLAVNRRFKNESGERTADFFDIVCWRQSAEFAANYLSKGRLVAVEGRLQQRNWQQADGQRRTKVEVVCDNIQGLDRPKDISTVSSQPDPESYEIPPVDDADYDPFS